MQGQAAIERISETVEGDNEAELLTNNRRLQTRPIKLFPCAIRTASLSDKEF